MARIMIADDSKATRELLKEIILKDNHECVAEASNGFEAIKKFKSSRPDVLLLDIFMPEKTGLEVLREIKNSHNSKIIMVTADSNANDISKSISEGAFGYLLKPFPENYVLQTIKKSLASN